MVEVCKYGLMAQDMRDSGKRIKLAAMEEWFTQKVISLKVSGKTIRPAVKESTFNSKGLSIKDVGLMISKMALVLRSGRTVLNMKDTMPME